VKVVTRTVVFWCAVLLASASTGSAQVLTTPGEPDPAQVRIRIGPLWLNPTIALTNIGVDTNVFNDPPANNPKRDVTLTLTPSTQLWLRLGPSWLSGTIEEQVIWFQKYTNQRSANTRYQGSWRLPLNRLIINAAGSYAHTRDRPGFEIDERAQRTEKNVEGGVEIAALSRTFFGVRAAKAVVSFEEGSFFRNGDLSQELNRTSTSYGVTMRRELTPLTNLLVQGSRQQDRFAMSPLRDSDSSIASIGLRLDQFALIKGFASVGYREFTPLQPGVPAFNGVTATADLTYTILGVTRLGVQVTRDVNYSSDVNQPYYLLTGISGSVAQQLFGPLDIVARAGAQPLGYTARAVASRALVPRTDSVRSYGLGFGYHIGDGVRIGVNVDQSTRRSPLPDHRYEGLRAGSSVTYGF
jgi:hypothetical protein